MIWLSLQKACGPGVWVNYFRGWPKAYKQHLVEAVDASLKEASNRVHRSLSITWPDRQTNFFGRLGYRHRGSADETPIDEALTLLSVTRPIVVKFEQSVCPTRPRGGHDFPKIARREGLPVVASVQNPYSLLNPDI